MDKNWRVTLDRLDENIKELCRIIEAMREQHPEWFIYDGTLRDNI